jgi:hypothetical protein
MTVIRIDEPQQFGAGSACVAFLMLLGATHDEELFAREGQKKSG